MDTIRTEFEPYFGLYRKHVIIDVVFPTPTDAANWWAKVEREFCADLIGEDEFSAAGTCYNRYKRRPNERVCCDLYAGVYRLTRKGYKKVNG